MNKIYIFKFLLVFIVSLILLKLPAIQPAVEYFCLLLAKITEFVMTVFGVSVTRQDNAILHDYFAAGIVVTKQCSALSYCAAIGSAVAVYPKPVLMRIKAIAIFCLFIQSVNILRLISIVYAKSLFSENLFNTIHEQVWLVIFTTITCVWMLFWVTSGSYPMRSSKVQA